MPIALESKTYLKTCPNLYLSLLLRLPSHFYCLPFHLTPLSLLPLISLLYIYLHFFLYFFLVFNPLVRTLALTPTLTLILSPSLPPFSLNHLHWMRTRTT